ncbi:TetR/AcrR family transcriptional regulator [Paractinoplanes lichenicola]|uniref:Helix-turn-helix transcriptional regulator n=1 Tax=Paractinoplanes lichenicola TaxID=2802976 RepID=A0ABS1VT87_9ACTN|nr:helix-turn-helix domain-containing protein [Actinoplanes lichenicola]MBL7257678.1 helix-turn-helix transcriptional regulator [Actinoplanes lichenicola]
MGRPRAFDENEVVRAAVALFAGRAYDSVSVDDLVHHLGVHRNSLYKVFGSKRGLYLAALRRGFATSDPDLDLLLLAMVERAPVDAEVAALVQNVLHDLDRSLGSPGATSTLLGDRLRARATP